jgi:hypothetical protein
MKLHNLTAQDRSIARQLAARSKRIEIVDEKTNTGTVLLKITWDPWWMAGSEFLVEFHDRRRL